MMLVKNIKTTFEMIKFEHTLSLCRSLFSERCWRPAACWCAANILDCDGDGRGALDGDGF
ncbi:MAG: hypothetical protein WKF30_11205 [Pyrinomonadaceae bacterium]